MCSLSGHHHADDDDDCGDRDDDDEEVEENYRSCKNYDGDDSYHGEIILMTNHLLQLAIMFWLNITGYEMVRLF